MTAQPRVLEQGPVGTEVVLISSVRMSPLRGRVRGRGRTRGRPRWPLTCMDLRPHEAPARVAIQFEGAGSKWGRGYPWTSDLEVSAWRVLFPEMCCTAQL